MSHLAELDRLAERVQPRRTAEPKPQTGVTQVAVAPARPPAPPLREQIGLGDIPSQPQQSTVRPMVFGASLLANVVLILLALVFVTGRGCDGMPGPGPSPAPFGDRIAADGAYVVFVEETADRAQYPFMSSIQSDLAFTTRLEARGIEVRFYDQDSPKMAIYRRDFDAAGLPALMVLSPDGKPVRCIRCPDAAEAVEAEINKVLK